VLELRVLDERIEERVRHTLESHPSWPCRHGCDECCRSLTNPPLLTKPEWDRVAAALTKLDAETRRQIDSRLLAPWSRICPLLDNGSCLVYEDRPISCRSYGFYADREAGLYCSRIEQRVQSGDLDNVVWGNQEAVEHSLDQLGARRTLMEWAGD